MNRVVCALVPVVAAVAAGPVSAFTFSLVPVTSTTPNFASPILINGTVTMAVGETFLPPAANSVVNLPFLAGFTAGFNGSGQTFDAAFLAWNGLGSYSGPIYDNQVSANNLGYAGGMPVGMYGSNVLGPGGQSSIILKIVDGEGRTRSFASNYAIEVVPAPGVMGVMGIGGLLAARRRR